MKNIKYSVVILVACCITASAAVTPIDRGSAMLGGYMYYENQSVEGYSRGIFMLSSDFGGFIIPGFMLGASIALSSIDGETAFGLGPVIGYYFNANPGWDEIIGSVYPYFKAFFKYAGQSGTSAHQTGFGGAAGINVMISDAVAMDLGILVSFDKTHSDWRSWPTVTTLRAGAGIVSFIY